MPSVKRTGVKAAEVKTGFESYDGPAPSQRGMYRAHIAILQYKKFRPNPDTGKQSDGLKIQVILEAAKGDPKGHAKFDGYPQFFNLVFGDKEALITRENNFYAALALKDEPVIVYEDKGDVDQGVDIKTLGGKSLAAIRKMYVNVDLKRRNDGQDGMEVDGIYKLKEVAGTARGAAKSDEPEEDADMLEEPEEAEEETETEDRADELAGAALPDLRALAKEYGITTVGKKKDALIEAILDYEADLPDEDEEAEEPDEEEEEPEEEEEEDGEREARAAELEPLDRAALKKIIKGLQPDFKVFASTSDDDLRAAILKEEFGDDEETPF
jgi:hypothetical protein